MGGVAEKSGGESLDRFLKFVLLILIMETNEEKGREFTPQELMAWYNPKTWFRKSLTPRTHEELEQSGLGQKRLS